MYCSIDDIKSAITEATLINLVNDEKAQNVDLANQESEPVKRINKAIEDADEEINGYLRKRFTLPLPEGVGQINKIAIDITVFNLYNRRSGSMSERIEKAYERRISQLKDIQKGIISLGIEEPDVDTSLDSSPMGSLTNKASEDRIFSDSSWRRF